MGPPCLGRAVGVVVVLADKEIDQRAGGHRAEGKKQRIERKASTGSLDRRNRDRLRRHGRATGGAASVTGRTQPVPGAWAAAAIAAAPHKAAAGAPPVIAVNAAQGLICGTAAVLDAATAPLELTKREPAINTPTIRFKRDPPMTILPEARARAPAKP